MTFLGSIFSPEAPAHFERGRILLRQPRMEDYEGWASLRAQSRSFLEPWEPLWSDHDLTSYGFRQRLRMYAQQVKEDSAYPFFIFDRGAGHLVGAITLANVRRGVAQMCTVGYWIGQPHQRQGYMTDALELAVDHSFEALGLHRVEAACLPSNAASIALLKRCSFGLEGLARNYLKIAGIWQDHLLFSRIAS
jgi:[ribosomal protein S5]-alanine N-acetyltransferase